MTDKPAAFTVSLGINSGRHSPSNEPQDISVYADAKVRVFFAQGAFILRSIHNRDHAQLEKDFDLYLKRRGSSGDICLNPSREIAEYGIKKNDELEFRHKTLPISVSIDLYPGEQRVIEVNSGHPVMDVVPSICEQFGIEHTQELSLAQEQRNKDSTATQYQWLDQQRALNGQGIRDGDTLLLRKKYFILNDDVQEAVNGNSLLSELLYHQICDMFVGDNFIGITGDDKEETLALVCCCLHHIEQKEKSISDEKVASKVIPKCRQHDQALLSKLVTAYFQECMVSLSRDQVKNKLLELFLQPQSILMTYYPVKVADDPQEYILACHSNAITLCTVEDHSLSPVDEKVWWYINIRGTNCTRKQQTVSVNAFGSWQEFITSYSYQISSHVLECLALIKKRTVRIRKESDQSSTPPVAVEPPRSSPEPPHTLTVSPPTPEAKPSMDYKLDVAEKRRSQEILVVNEVVPSINNPPPVIHVSTTPPQIVVEPDPGTPTEEKKKHPLTPSTDLSFSIMHIPEYFGLDYREVLRDYRLFHIVVMNKDKRTMLLNIKKPVREVITSTCAVFGIHDDQRQKFWLPRGKRSVLQKYGGKPKKRIGKFLRKTTLPTAPEPGLKPDKSIELQYNFSVKPLVLHLHYRPPQVEEDTDLDVPHEEVDMGMEWPPHESGDVRSYRQFYQSWCGAVQGAYPMVKNDAIRLAALLTHTYYGDRTLYKTWPPSDYDVKAFLPETYCKSLGIASDVEKAYKRLSGRTPQECIIEAAEFCSKKTTHQGIFYEVSVPGQSDIMAVIRWKKMQPQLFGINRHGVFSVDRETGDVLFTHRFSDIFDWKYGENTFKLNFSPWSKDYHAYTYQREEILDTLQLYIDMTRDGVISQAPSRPSSIMEDLMEGSVKMKPKMDSLALGLGTDSQQFSINISVSPESSPEPTTPEPLNEDDSLDTDAREVMMSAV